MEPLWLYAGRIIIVISILALMGGWAQQLVIELNIHDVNFPFF